MTLVYRKSAILQVFKTEKYFRQKFTTTVILSYTKKEEFDVDRGATEIQ